jgi:phosphopantetheine adenylyltransferase
VKKYSARAEHIGQQLEAVKEAIERQIRHLSALRGPAEAPALDPVVLRKDTTAEGAERFRPAVEKTPREI